MTREKSDLLKTSKNRRVSPYGEYYISVKKVEIFRDEREDCESSYSSPPRLPYPQLSFGYPMLIRAVFESDKEYFGKTSKQRWIHNIPLSTNAYTISQSDYHFDVSIYFPSLTTLNIIKGKRFIKLLLRDKEIYNALAHFLDHFDIPGWPGNRPIGTLESFLKRQIMDIETRLKLQIGYPIDFEDIEGAQNMEVREEALRKFGYEDYVKEGFEKDRIKEIIIDRGEIIYNDASYYFIGNEDPNKKPLIPKRFNPKHNKDEKIIVLANDICFLQVEDTSTGKTYFLKVPPDVCSVEEAKAWTFGLNLGEYNPVAET